MWRYVGKIYLPISKGLFYLISEGGYGCFNLEIKGLAVLIFTALTLESVSFSAFTYKAKIRDT